METAGRVLLRIFSPRWARSGRSAGICLVLTLALCATGLAAQPRAAAYDARRLDVPRDLNDGWLIRPGDDPSYASPALDDSDWTSFNLQTQLAKALRGAHSQVVWYRLHLQVDPTQTGIALREETLARAFEVYVNGERLMSSGRLAPFRSTPTTPRFSLPFRIAW